MKVDFQWDKSIKQIVKEQTGDNLGALFLANEAKRLMDPYVPATQEEILADAVRVYVEDGMGIVEYTSPYAHYQWEGKVYGPNYPIFENGKIVGWRSPPHKTPTGKTLVYSTFPHPLATSHWDKAMMTARGDDLAKAYQEFINGGAK